jgi:hypothetical protein
MSFKTNIVSVLFGIKAIIFARPSKNFGPFEKPFFTYQYVWLVFEA